MQNKKMEESITLAIRATRKFASKLWNTSSKNNIVWARWCLPSFNSNCDQHLKGYWADIENSCCYKPVQQKQLKLSKDTCPWENPTALIYLQNGYGI